MQTLASFVHLGFYFTSLYSLTSSGLGSIQNITQGEPSSWTLSHVNIMGPVGTSGCTESSVNVPRVHLFLGLWGKNCGAAVCEQWACERNGRAPWRAVERPRSVTPCRFQPPPPVPTAAPPPTGTTMRPACSAGLIAVVNGFFHTVAWLPLPTVWLQLFGLQFQLIGWSFWVSRWITGQAQFFKIYF